MDMQLLKAAAFKWVSAWNDRDIDQIMAHYADDVEFYSPTVTQRWGIKEGKLTGKAEVQKHFQKGLELVPDLRFELIDILTGIDGILIVYKRESGKIVADYVKPDETGKVKLVKVFVP